MSRSRSQAPPCSSAAARSGSTSCCTRRWHDAFYRTAVTVTLTGLDSSPRGPGAEYLTIALALGGVAIFGYVAAQAVEAIAREVTAEARKDKRRRRMIDNLEQHFIICGYGRVGRRAAEEFEASGQRYVVLDTGAEAIETRAQARHPVRRGKRLRRRLARERRDRPRARPARLGRLRRGEPLHHAVGARRSRPG